MRKQALGRGLDALIPTENEINKYYDLVDIQRIKPNKYQPRKSFDDNALNELANSIKANGLIQPIVVRRKGKYYEIIAGERRWRASKIAGIEKIGVLIKDVLDSNTLEMALIENLQREELNPIEEAEAYKQLVNNLNLTHEEISKRIGKNRSTITNQIRLLELTDKVKESLVSKKITTGHARALLGLEIKNQIDTVLNEILRKNLSVRKTEERIKQLNSNKNEKVSVETETYKIEGEDYFIENVREEIMKVLGTKVKIKRSGKLGRIEIEYYSLEELDRIVGMILSNG